MPIGLTCVIVLAALLLAGCGGDQPTTSEGVSVSYASEILETDYEGALDVSGQLALGTVRLEGTAHAVTPEQAETLLPLWQALRGSVTAEAEVGAVLRGIEGAMTEEQLAAIADMELTEEDVQAWMEELGVGASNGFRGGDLDPDAGAARQAQSGGQGGGQMPPDGEMPSHVDMPLDMATRRAEIQSMSEEEREAAIATIQAEGGFGRGFRGGAGENGSAAPAGVGQILPVLRPLIAVLEERAR
jgi:hypothetical protein